MKKLLFCFFMCGAAAVSFSQTVTIQYGASPRQSYAAGVLEKSVSTNGHAVKKSGGEYVMIFSTDEKLGKEAFSIKTSDKRITITGGDENGILYGSLSV